jgi:undecaprenyl diphosphate synthase
MSNRTKKENSHYKEPVHFEPGEAISGEVTPRSQDCRVANSPHNDLGHLKRSPRNAYGDEVAIKHLAIIMDGNRRWAKEHKLPAIEGHRHGAQKIKTIISNVIEFNIPYLTLYTFSSENWNRSQDEVSWLLNLLGLYLKKELTNLMKNGIRLKVIGRLELLNEKLRSQINEAMLSTKDNNKITLCIAFSYGGRWEIIDACKKIIDSGAKEFNESDFKNYLYDPEMPDVDMLIRTGGSFRISNFLLWQSSYAELYFSAKYWPDFNKQDLTNMVNDYFAIRRTFGAQ